MHATVPRSNKLTALYALGFAVALLLALELARATNHTGAGAALAWLPSGIYIVALLITTSRDWPWFVIAALAGHYISGAIVHDDGGSAVSIAWLTSTLEALAVGWIGSKYRARSSPTPATGASSTGASPANDIRSAAPLQAIFDSMGESVMVVDSQGRGVFFNRAAKELFGLKPLAQGLDAWAHAENVFQLRDGSPYPKEQLPMARALKGETVEDHEMLVSDPITGGNLIVSKNARPVDLGARGTGALVVARDVTQRIWSEERFRIVVESAPSAMLMVDRHGSIVLLNEQAVRMFGYPRGELIGKKLETLVPERLRASHVGQREAFLEQPRARAMGEGRDLFGVRKDGSEVAIEIGLTPLFTPDGPFVLATVIDISARKRAEDAVRRSLNEKEVLLRELHHRVKNNLQIVSSLLRMQARSLPDEHAAGVLRESEDRIHSMSLIHERLYRSDEHGAIHLPEYVRDLVQGLASSYAVDKSRIEIVANIADASLPLDQAVPCGLVLTELISNSFKHAFADERRGRVEVTISVGIDEQLELCVRDDGVGWRSDLNVQGAKTLGLRLVRVLVEQLGGQVELDGRVGATTNVRFPIQQRAGVEVGHGHDR